MEELPRGPCPRSRQSVGDRSYRRLVASHRPALPFAWERPAWNGYGMVLSRTVKDMLPEITQISPLAQRALGFGDRLSTGENRIAA